MFQHCEVLNDESSGEEDDGIDGVEYVSSETNAVQAGDSKTPDSNTASIILSQVNIASLTSPCTDPPTENANLLCYDDLVKEIPAMLINSWSMKLYPKQKEVPFRQHPQYKAFTNCAILHQSSLPQPGQPAVSTSFCSILFSIIFFIIFFSINMLC